MVNDVGQDLTAHWKCEDNGKTSAATTDKIERGIIEGAASLEFC